ncbi:MAG: 2Fe-2S iron-sulfur cluster binding domain-containing protein [Acidobacteriota bacterium]|nr:2Fe-2S iron-sulfur cluster binding domain-containing protein [Acidobacteriota bacterium]
MTGEHTITLLPFEKRFTCGEDETILAAALRQGINLRYGCKHGGCGTCKALIVDGEVDQLEASTFALMDFEREQGMALLCSAYPLGDLAIELSDYEESELEGGSPIGKFLAEVDAIEYLTHDIVGLKLGLIEPERISFKAGQYVDVLVPGTSETRSYSMANPPSRDGEVELMVKLMAGGLFSEYLRGRLKVGDRLTLEGPYGSFHLRENERPALFIAGGSGMAPMLSLLRDMAEQRDRRSVTFFYGARAKRDLFDLDELAGFAKLLPCFRFVPALSEPATRDQWTGATGLITEVVAREVPDAHGMEAYLCGPSVMIDAAIAVLGGLGVSEHDIHYDKFVTKAETPT